MTAVRGSDYKGMELRDKAWSEILFGVKARTELELMTTHVSFFGHFGLGNFGNESTLQAILYHRRRHLPNAEVRCICTGPEATATTHNITAVPLSRIVVKAWRPHNLVSKVLRSVF